MTWKCKNRWIVLSGWNHDLSTKSNFLCITCEFGMNSTLTWAYLTLEKDIDTFKMEWLSTLDCGCGIFTEISASIFFKRTSFVENMSNDLETSIFFFSWLRRTFYIPWSWSENENLWQKYSWELFSKKLPLRLHLWRIPLRGWTLVDIS